MRVWEEVARVEQGRWYKIWMAVLKGGTLAKLGEGKNSRGRS